MILELRMIACFQQRNGEVNRKKNGLYMAGMNYLGLKRCHCLNAVFQGGKELEKILLPNLGKRM